MRRRPWRSGVGALAAAFGTFLAVATSAAAVTTTDPTRYWTGSLSVTRTANAEDQFGATVAETYKMVGHVRSPALHPRTGTDGSSILEVGEVVDEWTFSRQADILSPCFSNRVTSTHSVTPGSLAAREEVDIWIGRPLDVLDGSLSPQTVVTVPGGADETVAYRLTSTPGCGEPIREESSVRGPPFHDGACSGTDPYRWLPLPAPTLLPDGSLQIAGTRVTDCKYAVATETINDTMTVTIDVIGTLTPPVEITLTAAVGVIGGGRGRISGSIDCGIGLPAACSQQFAYGATAKLAALPSETSKFQRWEGCDSTINQQCTVTMTRVRSVRAWFGYDFVGQAEPPPDGLFDLDRKIEIASSGAENAQNGAIGCAATALVIGTAGLGGEVLGVGVAGSGASLSELGAKLAEETIGSCVQGVLGTIGNGVLLTIDPPDPNWRKAAFAEFLPRAKVSGCRLRRACTRILAARRRLVDTSTRVAELQEVLAVAANRYGNALGHADKPGLLVHRATMRATSGMLAAAIAVRDRRRAELAKHLRAAGVRSLVIPKRAARAALRQHAKGRGIPKAAIDRLLRKHLVTSAVEVRAAIRAGAGKTKATRLDILALLRRKTPTTAMRSAAAALTVADLAILLDAFHADRSTPAAVRVRHEELMAAILRCDAVSAANLKLLAKDVEAKTGLGGEPGRQVAFVARRLAAKGRPAGPACG